MSLEFYSRILKSISLFPAFYWGWGVGLTSLYFDKWPQIKLPRLTKDICALCNETHIRLWIGSARCSAELWGAPVWLSLGKAVGADDGLGSVSCLPSFSYLRQSTFASTVLQGIIRVFDILTVRKLIYFC